MQTISLIWGILAAIGMLVGFIPCIGAWNWVNIPFAGIGVIICAVTLGMSKESNKNKAVAGLICCIVAILFGFIRLAIGGGVL